jgi:hypothetical protein
MKKDTVKEYLEFYTVYLHCFPRTRNPMKHLFFNVCIYFSTWTTLIIEVFTRKDFGERHFVFAPAIRLAILLALLPFVPGIINRIVLPAIITPGTPPDIKSVVPKQYSGMIPEGMAEEAVKPDTLPVADNFVPETDFSGYILWYVFIVAFVFMAFRHYRAQLRRPSVLERPHHTRYAGKIHKWFFAIQLPGLKTNIRTVECWYEPGIFFIGGWFMFAIGQNIGWLLMVSAVLYSGYACSAYYFGREAIMNSYDELIDRQIKDRIMNDGIKLDGSDEENPFQVEPIDEKDFRDEVARNMAGNMKSFQVKIPH